MSKMTRSEIEGLNTQYAGLFTKNCNGGSAADAHNGFKHFWTALRMDGPPNLELRGMAQVVKHYLEELKTVRGTPAEVVAKTQQNAAECSAALHAVVYITAGNVSKAIKGARRMVSGAPTKADIYADIKHRHNLAVAGASATA